MAKKKQKTSATSTGIASESSKKDDIPLVVVLPGDNVTGHVRVDDGAKLGTGLRYDSSTKQVYATLSGRLEQKINASGNKKNVFFVKQNLRRRYRPRVEDRVLGIVEDRMGSDGAGGDIYRVNIGSSHPALLSNLSFEGATKRNKPALQTGQLLYARVAGIDKSQLLDPVLSCQLGPHDAGIPRKDWMTNEGCYGELKGGTVCRISTGLARELLHPSNLALSQLAKARIAFEVAIGVNGFLWIHSQLPEYTILIQNVLKNSEVLTEEQVRGMVKTLVYTVQKQLQMDRDSME